MPLSRQQFIERLNASGVMTADEARGFETSLAGDRPPADAQGLAKLLVSSGKLTKYQAAAIYQGKTKGLVLGNYVILDKIGAGGMGQVFKALHRRMKRVVALKVLPAEATKDEDAVRRFHREVEAAARLEHPNIVTAHDADEADGMHFLVMQYADGKDLSELVKENGPFPVPQAVECIRQAACGLAYAHKNGVIHRDIKPANLLLDQEGTVRILDMGLARLESQIAEQAQAAGLTQSGQIMGTVDYMSPEQAEETRGVDGRADMYSLGCTLYVLLVGQPMFQGTTTIAKLMAHRTAPIPSLRASRADVPEALEEVYQRMVAKDPDDRHGSMDEVVAALETCLGEAAPAKLDGPSSSDSALTDFLQQIGRGTVATGQRAATEVDGETMPRVPTKEETGTAHRVSASLPPVAAAPQPSAPSQAAPSAAAVAARRGQAAKKSAVPLLLILGGGAASLLLLVAFAGGLIWLLSGPDAEPPAATGDNQPPPLAVAPFNEATAKKHQQAWADYLGEAVETSNSLGMKLVLIPPGKFTMGEGSEAVAVELTQPLRLGVHEVTQQQWQSLMGTQPWKGKLNAAEGADRPAMYVSWNDAQAFCRKLTEQERAAKRLAANESYRLPTEAEWEYACRAGTVTAYSFGDDPARLGEYAWFEGNTNKNSGAKPVGAKKPNPWGLYDVHGNVWEWCSDWYAKDTLPSGKDPKGASSGWARVYKGGGWRYGEESCQSTSRRGEQSQHSFYHLGFRVARTIAQRATTMEPPPPAVAPFDEAQAKAHQQAWADYLGVPAEREITLPGGTKLTMVLIPPGEFLMGSTPQERVRFLEEAKAANDTSAVNRIPSEGPQHRVRITRPFYLGKYEVTQAQWESAMGSNPSHLKDNPSHPVEKVSRDDIQPFLAKLNDSGEADKMKFSLPTEAQWEYACRSGTTTAYYGGAGENDLREYGWFNGNSGGKTHPAGELKPNGFGLYDMQGNVWEWCADWYAGDYYANSPEDDPTGPSAGSSRVHRGGSWNGHPRGCRSANRIHHSREHRGHSLGFRLAASLDDVAQANFPASAESSNTPSTNAPPPAVAPFDEDEAKQHQQAWADYLGLPVEKEITLPGGAKLTLVLIPPGEFLMGSTDAERAKFLEEATSAKDHFAIGHIPSEGPQHRVRITRPFYLGMYEVTQRQWESVMGSKPSSFKDNPTHPVEQVSWVDIQTFLAKVNGSGAAQKMEFALPTEAQWEFACRSGTTTAYYGGASDNDMREYGWISGNSRRKTHPVGQLRPNGFGLYDMHGNVWEWCADWFAADYYTKSPTDDPMGPSAGSHRVFRGGCWLSQPERCRSANRSYDAPGARHDSLGFRLAAVIDTVAQAKFPASAGSSNATSTDAPPPAVAPFDEDQAKQHQQAWADYLRLPVEKEITLPGGAKLTMVLIPPGEFLMGSTPQERARSLEEAKAANDLLSLRYIPTESPQHRVRITQPFYLGEFEVTQSQWQSVMGTNPSDFKDNPLHPVEQVSWDDIQPFLAKLNESNSAENLTFALPTEAQWEYACRAGTTRPYHGGESEDDLRETGRFNANSGGKTHPVGELRPNGFNLYDMHGNVWEWCADWYAGDHYTKTRMVDPTGPSAGTMLVFRGGSWRNPPWCCRSAYRDRSAPDVRYSILGFRLAAVIDTAKLLTDLPATGGGDFALAFDEGQTVEVESFLMDASRELTVEAYVEVEKMTGKDVDLLALGGYRLQMENTGKWRFYAEGSDWRGTHGGTATAGQRVHIAAVKRNRAGLQYFLFVDGKKIHSTGRETSPSGVKRGLTLGGAGRVVLDEVRISKVARYLDETHNPQDFAPPRRLDADGDTLALYHFDEGAGDVLRDSSGNEHHGKIVGAKWIKSPNPSIDHSVDLLALIDPAKHALDPGVRKENGVLLTPRWNQTNTRVVIPYRPVPQQYDLRLVAERRGDDRFGLNLGFVMGGRQASLDMDGGSDPAWCISRIDGKSMHSGNVTVVMGKRFAIGQRRQVDLQVRRDGVRVLLDGEELINWRGRAEQLSLWDKIKLPDSQSLFLFSQAEFAIHELTLTEPHEFDRKPGS